MLNLKHLALCVIVVTIALVFSADDDGGSNAAYEAAKGLNTSAIGTIQNQRYCPPAKNTTDCGDGSFAHHYDCCGTDQSECCFALQIWVYIVLGVLVLAMIISTIVGIICCCCKK